jgi:hypothetical protein
MIEKAASGHPQESGPLHKTICGKAYNAADRFRARMTMMLDGTECKGCRKLVLNEDNSVIFTHPTPASQRKKHLKRFHGGAICGQGGGVAFVPTTNWLNEVTCKRCLVDISYRFGDGRWTCIP